MKSLFTLLLFSILFTSVLANQSFAQQEDQVPGPPPMNQMTHLLNIAFYLAGEFKVIYKRIE